MLGHAGDTMEHIGGCAQGRGLNLATSFTICAVGTSAGLSALTIALRKAVTLFSYSNGKGAHMNQKKKLRSVLSESMGRPAPYKRYLTIDNGDMLHVSFFDSLAAVTLGSQVRPLPRIHNCHGMRGDWEALGYDLAKVMDERLKDLPMRKEITP